MYFFEWGYWGLFVIAFLAATILPLSSEGVLIALLVAGYDPILCLIVASIGNILGGLTNYFIGRLGNPKWLLKLGMSTEKLHSFEGRVSKYGHWMALLAWVPIIGDPLTVALGYFRVQFIPFLGLMAFGKIVRYAIIIFVLNV